jgi:hypothetical protein
MKRSIGVAVKKPTKGRMDPQCQTTQAEVRSELVTEFQPTAPAVKYLSYIECSDMVYLMHKLGVTKRRPFRGDVS